MSSDKTDYFINNFDVDKIRELSGRLSELHNKDGIVQDDMNSFVNSLNSVYVENCKTTFETTVQKSKSYDTNNNAKWFNKRSKTARKRFYNVKFQYKLRKRSGENGLNICSKVYKKTLAKAQTKFKNSKIK